MVVENESFLGEGVCLNERRCKNRSSVGSR